MTPQEKIAECGGTLKPGQYEKLLHNMTCPKDEIDVVGMLALAHRFKYMHQQSLYELAIGIANYGITGV